MTIYIRTIYGDYTESDDDLTVEMGSDGFNNYQGEKITEITASLSSSPFTLTITPQSGAGTPRVETIRVSHTGSGGAAGGLTWSYSGSDLVLVFTTPPSGHEYLWEFDEEGESPPIKLNVKIARP